MRPIPAPKAGSPLPADWLLLDRQTRVAGDGTERAYRVVKRINTPEGVQDESERRVTFDPSYERVQVHDLRLIRDGVARDALGSADYRVLNREAGLEEALLDGRLSASSSSMTSAPATSSTSPGRCREIRPSSAVISTS